MEKTLDYAEAKAMFGNQGLSQYEQIKVNHMQRRASGTAIAGLVVSVGAAVATVGVAAWATAKASEARRTAAAENAGTAALLRQMANQFATEHAERVQGDVTLNQTITDTVSGQQSGSLTATQQAELNAYQQMLLNFSTGEYTKTPMKVALYRDAQACGCPATGCGCGQ